MMYRAFIGIIRIKNIDFMIKTWIKNARSESLPQSVMPAVVAVVLAIGAENFCWWIAVLAVLGVALAHLSANLADDYFDYKADMLKDREKVVRQGIKAFTAKYPYLTDGSATPKQLRNAVAGFGLAAIACGVAICLVRGWELMLVAAVAGVLAFFYSAPPLKLCYHGLGELVTGLIFGPLLMLGVYWAAAGSSFGDLWWGILGVSVPMGLLVTNILFTHSMIDKAGDTASEKKTLAAVWPKANMAISWMLIFVPFLIIFACVALGRLGWPYLLVALMLPRAIWLYWSLIQFQKGADFEKELEKPRKMLGPMGDWATYRKLGLDWFLIRWLTARNIVSGYCLVIIVVKVAELIFLK